MSEHVEPGTWKHSAVVASTGDGTDVYDKLDDMSPILRAECLKALQSKDTVTIIIADSAGREHLQRIIAEQTPAAPIPPVNPAPQKSWRLALEIALAGVVGLTLWLLAALR